MQQKSMSGKLENLSVICLGRMLLRQLWMLVAASLIFAMGSAVLSQWFNKPVYRASMTYVVTSRQTGYGSNHNLTATREVAAVMKGMLTSNSLVEEIRGYSGELSDFDGMIRASQVGESNLLTVTAESETPKNAFMALQALIEVFPPMVQYLSNKCVVQVIQNPSISTVPINAVNARRNALVAGALGALVMAVLLCWLEIRYETVQTVRGARNLLDARILAVVDHERKGRTVRTKLRKHNRGLRVFAPGTSFIYAEQINNVCASLEQEMLRGDKKVFLITGVGENEGKSTIASNVAAMMAMKGKQVVLVDGDLRKPELHRMFDRQYKPGLSLEKLLAKPYDPENVQNCLVRHPMLGMYMMFPLKPSKRPVEMIGSATMEMTLRQLRGFDCVIVDSPPMGFFVDALSLADMVDGTVLVVRQGYSSACDINDAVDALNKAKSKFLGCVLNNMWGFPGSRGRYGHGYGYGYGATAKQAGKPAHPADSEKGGGHV